MRTRFLALTVFTIAVLLGGIADSEAAQAAKKTATLSITRLDKAGVDKYLESLKGKVVIVDFWATWCPPCRQEIPGFIELQKQYGDKGLVVVGLSLDDETETVKEFCKTQKVNYPVFVVGQDTTAAWGNIEAIPTTFILDKAGKKVGAPRVGYHSKEAFEKEITPLLK
ncbi:MAG: TlpA family protein disulfide reductase [Verrucomicrobia bacterium]|nr:TlpA family protein disulfide reductase [Verrucomicrobiota bacterium]